MEGDSTDLSWDSAIPYKETRTVTCIAFEN